MRSWLLSGGIARTRKHAALHLFHGARPDPNPVGAAWLWRRDLSRDTLQAPAPSIAPFPAIPQRARATDTIWAGQMNKKNRSRARSLAMALIVSVCWWPVSAAAQVEAPKAGDPCEARIAHIRAELYRLDETQQPALGGGLDNRDSPLGMINTMVADAQGALDRGNEERCLELVGSAERALAGLEN